MNRLTDEEIRKMTPIEPDAYTERNPEEAMRIAKIFAASAINQTKKALTNSINKS